MSSKKPPLKPPTTPGPKKPEIFDWPKENLVSDRTISSIQEIRLIGEARAELARRQRSDIAALLDRLDSMKEGSR